MQAEPDTGPVYSVADLGAAGTPDPGGLPPGVWFEPQDDARDAHVLPETAAVFGVNADTRARAYRAMAGKPLHRVGVFRVAGGQIVGRGLVATRGGVLLAGAAITATPGTFSLYPWGALLTCRQDGCLVPKRPGMVRRRIDGPAILGICPGYLIYGHILVDWLPRILLAAGLTGPDVPVIVPAALPGYARELLAMLGIDPGRLIAVDETREIVSVDELIVGGQVRAASHWWPGAARLLRPLLGQAEAGADLPRRFYVTRGQVSNQRRRLLNRDAVDAALHRRGFQPVAPETLPLARQLALFARAECVVGESGSGLHNSVFGTPGLRVGVLQADTLGSFLQASLCGALDQPVAFAFGASPSLTPIANYGDFLVDPEALQAMLDHVARDRPD